MLQSWIPCRRCLARAQYILSNLWTGDKTDDGLPGSQGIAPDSVIPDRLISKIIILRRVFFLCFEQNKYSYLNNSALSSSGLSTLLFSPAFLYSNERIWILPGSIYRK